MKIEHVNHHDNFFTLNNNSILNLQIITHTQHQNIHLTPKQLFKKQNITKLTTLNNIIPIDQPLPNVHTLIINTTLTPLPQNTINKLYLNKPNLTHNYLNHPKLTTTNFLPNPFTNNKHLYHTNNHTHLLTNKHIKFLKHNNNQIKIHNYHITLNKIITQLHNLTNITNTHIQLNKHNQLS